MLDLIIKHGRIVDGTGAPGCIGDVAIAGGKIVDIGTLPPVCQGKSKTSRLGIY